MRSSLASKQSQSFSADLRQFMSNEKWTFAKTYAKTWPHEYMVRGQVDAQFLVKLIEHIRTNGYQGHFYEKEITHYGKRTASSRTRISEQRSRSCRMRHRLKRSKRCCRCRLTTSLSRTYHDANSRQGKPAVNATHTQKGA